MTAESRPLEEPTVAKAPLGWGAPNPQAVIAGVLGEVAVCYNADGAPVATIDHAGRMGLYGLYIVDGVRLNAIPKNQDIASEGEGAA